MSSLALSSLLMVFGIQDYFQTGSAVRANFPVLGRLRYFFESIRPELRQYFWEDDDAELPYSRNQRAMVYQRAKSEFSIRALSMLFYVGDLVLIYVIGKKYFSNTSAILTICFFSFLGFNLLNTTFSRPYASGTFFLLLAFYSSLKISSSSTDKEVEE